MTFSRRVATAPADSSQHAVIDRIRDCGLPLDEVGYKNSLSQSYLLFFHIT